MGCGDRMRFGDGIWDLGPGFLIWGQDLGSSQARFSVLLLPLSRGKLGFGAGAAAPGGN